MKCWVICGVLLFWSAGTWARHIIGGDIALTKRANETNGFNIILTLIYDDAAGVADEKTFVSIFRKSNNTRVEDFTLSRTLKQELPYTNAQCVGNIPTSRITRVQYMVDVTLATNTYNETDGYYLAWEECCRNGNILNLQTPSRVGLVFYAEIPPVNIPNSSAVFKTPEVKYVCAGKNFEADFGATDADGDELRYALVTPLVGSTDGGGTFPSRAKQGPYRRAVWSRSFDSTKVILGTIPLNIHPTTGKITLNASQLGVFAFAVRCEEWRNGTKIGEVRREFIFNVVDCTLTAVTPVNITLKQAAASVSFETQPSGHTTAVKICRGDSATLKADDENPKWSYQWRQDGKLILGATKTTLPVNQTGKYTLIKKYAQGCTSEDSTINMTEVMLKSAPIVSITANRPLPLCNGDSINLSIQNTDKNTVQWRKNNEAISNTTNTLLYIKEAGVYSVSITDQTSKCSAKDSIIIKKVIGPVASLSLVGTPIFCSNDSVKLITPKTKDHEYVWFLNDFPLVPVIDNFFYPKKSGKYSVAIVDTATKCATRSSTFDIIVKPSPIVSLDSIPPLCTTGLQAVTLVGTPTGGVFSGTGVVANRFITQNLTAGNYPITYTYSNADGCAAKDTKWARLAPPPRIELPKNLVVLRGDSIEIRTSIPQNSTVNWFPSIGLNNPQSPRPIASPDRSTVYKANIITAQGCIAEGEVKITVVALTIPNGFTPNTDGVNDTWEIAGIKDYPNCTVEVFNRWGNLIFSNNGYQTSWDGLWNSEPVPVGTYYYHIYLREVEFKLTGSVSVIR